MFFCHVFKNKFFFNPAAKLAIPAGIWTKEAKVEMEKHSVSVKAEISKCSASFKNLFGLFTYCFTFNQFHNILRLSDVLPNFPFNTSETMCHYYL